jgi:hypothetical protein
VAVTGTGLAPARLVATPPQRGFGAVVTNATSSVLAVTVTNTGDVTSSALGVSITGADAAMFSTASGGTCSGTLAAGASCDVRLAFSPSSTGAKHAQLEITGGTAGTASATLVGTGIAASQLAITPTAHVFGNVNVGAISTAQELTVTNNSSTPTGALTTALTGATAAGFQIVAGTDTCNGIALAPAASCSISVAFAPSTGGLADAQLVVAGAPGGTVAASLAGVGIGPAKLTIAPASRAFGSVAIGDVSAPLQFTITNIGGQASSVPTVALGGATPAQFQLATTCTVALAPGGTCRATVAFAPATPTDASASLDISATVGGSVTATLTGTGAPTGSLIFVPAALPFPTLAVGETDEQTLTLVNTGTIPTSAIDLTVDDAAYSVVTTSCTTLAPGASCTATVRLAPTTAGAHDGSLHASAATGGSSRAALLATARPRLEIVAINAGPATSPHDLGTAIVNNTTPHDALITVRNNTAGAQPFSLATMFAGQFAVLGNTCDATGMIAAAGSCTVGVRFAPTTTGNKAGSITFAIGSGASNEAPQELTGTATEALVLLAPFGSAFGSVPINTQQTLRFLVTNPAGSVASGPLSTTLTGTAMSVSNDTCAGQQLASAGTCVIDVRFAPTAAGDVTGELVVSGTPGGSPSRTITASGIEPVGTQPTALTLTPGSVAEYSPSGTSVGTLATVDADVGQTYTYAFVGGIGSDNNSAFTLVGDQVRTNGVFDFETKNSYTIRVRTTDSGGYTFEQALAIEVTNLDEPPTAVNDSAIVVEDSAATTIDVRTNDTDVDGGLKTIETVTQPDHGQVAITNGGNDLTYQPDANFAGTDSFTYTLDGGSIATVTVTVTPVDDAPVAVDDSVTVLEDSGTTEIDVRANDTDIDGGPMTVTAVTQPAAGQGAVAISGGGTGVSYTTATNFEGTTSFTYTLDGASTATVTITVTPVDDPATAVDDAFTVAEDSAATTLDVLANDTDIDGGGAIALQSVTQPANGTVVLVGTTAVSYQPNADFAGTDTFTYTLAGGSTATVRVTVTNVDDAPVAVDDAATVSEDAGATAIPVLTNDTDIDGGTKNILSVTQPSHSTAVITWRSRTRR